ncbi:hypothetical protein A2U01_0090189, partial [Trifolium medium]|nr:hypothetical protein [Trifolium medium]
VDHRVTCRRPPRACRLSPLLCQPLRLRPLCPFISDRCATISNRFAGEVGGVVGMVVA